MKGAQTFEELISSTFVKFNIQKNVFKGVKIQIRRLFKNIGLLHH